MRKVRDHGSEAFRLGYDVAGQRRMKTRADQAKTGFRRLTKMQANLAAWLAPHRESVGLIAPANACKKLSAFAKAKGFPWNRHGSDSTQGG